MIAISYFFMVIETDPLGEFLFPADAGPSYNGGNPISSWMTHVVSNCFNCAGLRSDKVKPRHGKGRDRNEGEEDENVWEEWKLIGGESGGGNWVVKL